MDHKTHLESILYTFIGNWRFPGETIAFLFYIIYFVEFTKYFMCSKKRGTEFFAMDSIREKTLGLGLESPRFYFERVTFF
jgi:hypothetical protein